MVVAVSVAVEAVLAFIVSMTAYNLLYSLRIICGWRSFSPGTAAPFVGLGVTSLRPDLMRADDMQRFGNGGAEQVGVGNRLGVFFLFIGCDVCGARV